VAAELKELLADPESAPSRAKRLGAEAKAVARALDVAGAKVAELEARRAGLVAEGAKGLAAKPVALDKDLAAARQVVTERQAEADAVAPLADAARAESEAIVSKLASDRGSFHMEDIRRRLREKLDALAAKVGPDLEELAGMDWSLRMRFGGEGRRAVAAGLLDEALGEKP
jgi:hypothetical protein